MALSTLIFVGQSLANEGVSSLTTDPGFVFNNAVGFTLGWKFTVGANDINVTQLGYFDDNGWGNQQAWDLDQ